MYCHPPVSQTKIKRGMVQSGGNILLAFASFNVVYINSKSKKRGRGIKCAWPPKNWRNVGVLYRSEREKKEEQVIPEWNHSLLM